MPPPPRRLVALLGATASGKTAVAIEVAKRLPVEVIAADSRQLRRGMVIGTAAPSAQEQDAVRHHLVGIVEPDAPWTLADWLAAAREASAGAWSRRAPPLFPAGTGTYRWGRRGRWRVPADTRAG